MPVDSKHKDYNRMAARWKKQRAAIAGQDAIHLAGEDYLPRLDEESDKDYTARKARANYVNFTWRTIEGFVGMLFRKPPKIDVSPRVAGMLADVTKNGVDVLGNAREVAVEVLGVARCGVLVDYPAIAPRADGRTRTVAEAEKEGDRPHLAVYLAESIINWATAWKNGKTVLTMVVLEEEYSEPNPEDRFLAKTGKQWRVLELDEDGVYTQSLFRKEGGEDKLQDGYPVQPRMNNQPMREIPFQFFGPSECTPRVDVPPLGDLVDVNISHYQTTADIEHGAHKTALPTVVLTGVEPATLPNGQPDPEGHKFYLGGGAAITLPRAECQAFMLEFSGAGLESLEKRLDRKEAQMAVLGARMLEQQKSGVEAAETAEIHRSGEQSALATIGQSCAQGFARVYGWFNAWAGGNEADVAVVFNTDFFGRKLSAQELTAIVQAWQQGGMSNQEKFEALQKGGMIRDDKTFEEHETEIANDPSRLLAAPPATPGAPAGQKEPAAVE